MIQFTYETDRELFDGALRFSQRQIRRLIEKYPDFYPVYTQNGAWQHEGPAVARWCDGFLPGMMWLFYRRLGPHNPDARFWWDNAVRYSRPLEARKLEPEVHDLGFVFLSSYLRWFQSTQDDNLREVMVEAGRTMAAGFNEKGGYLRSLVAEDSLFIDIMMNVGLIFYAGRETNDRHLRDIAARHSLITRRHLVRGDGSVSQEGIFDLSTGEFLREASQQGYRGDSCWSRGLGWALYGFNTAYEYTRDPRFLQTAEACADYYITHSPSDGIPPWDFQAPPESRRLVDTSAAAIAAAGLLRLCRKLADPMKGHFYWSTALLILRNLALKYLASPEEEWEGILKGAVYHFHKDLGINESVMWGDYYFVEGLEEVLRVMGHTAPHVWVN